MVKIFSKTLHKDIERSKLGTNLEFENIGEPALLLLFVPSANVLNNGSILDYELGSCRRV